MKRTTNTTKDRPVNLRLTCAMVAASQDAARRTGLKTSDIMRLAIERGLPIVIKQLAVK